MQDVAASDIIFDVGSLLICIIHSICRYNIKIEE
jgi:hypothetical protein